jgi:hypothetical protein
MMKMSIIVIVVSASTYPGQWFSLSCCAATLPALLAEAWIIAGTGWRAVKRYG